MSNIPASNRPDFTVSHRIEIEIDSHLEEAPQLASAGEARPPVGLPAEALECLRRAAAVAATQRGMAGGRIEIAIVDDRQIRQVNRQHLDHDWETDVISFPYRCEADTVEGEVIVSWETAIREAARTPWPALTELALYVIHGTLHLTGMDDRDPAGRREMRAAELKALTALGLEGAQRYDVDRRSFAEDSPPDGEAAMEQAE